MHAGWEKLTPGKRYGKAVPRVFTPPARDLVPEILDDDGEVLQEATTWGYAVIDFATYVLEINLMPWQRWLLIHMLELGADGLLRFQTAVVLVARQNGKSTLSQVLSLWFMIVAKWPLVLGTAQDLTTAEEVWEGAVAILEDDPELTTLVEKVSQRNGKKMLTLSVPHDEPGKLASVTRYLVKAASRKAGRGLSGNLIILDELREQQTWAAWGAITKTTNAQLHSLIIGLSNAGDVTSVVLRYLRLMAHLAIGDPDGLNRNIGAGLVVEPTAEAVKAVELADRDDDADDDDDDLDDEDLEQDEATLFLAEWSAIPGVKVSNREGWAQANPALGHRVQERKIRGDSKTDPEWTFRTEVLCQWADSVLDGPFPPGSWQQGQNVPLCERDEAGNPILDVNGQPLYILGEHNELQVAPEDRIVGPYDVCVDQSSDRSLVYVVAAGQTADGRDQVEVMQGRAGTKWILPFLLEPHRVNRVKAITGQANGAPITPYLKDLAVDPLNPFEVIEWKGGDLTGGTALLFDAVRDRTVFHNIQPALDIAAGTAVLKYLGDTFLIDRRASETDVAPLIGAAGAYWLMMQREAPVPPPLPEPETIEGSPLDPDDDDTDQFGPGSLGGDLRTMNF